MSRNPAYSGTAQGRRAPGQSQMIPRSLSKALNKPIAPGSVGFDMLQKMGWEPGRGLGQPNEGPSAAADKGLKRPISSIDTSSREGEKRPKPNPSGLSSRSPNTPNNWIPIRGPDVSPTRTEPSSTGSVATTVSPDKPRGKDVENTSTEIALGHATVKAAKAGDPPAPPSSPPPPLPPPRLPPHMHAPLPPSHYGPPPPPHPAPRMPPPPPPPPRSDPAPPNSYTPAPRIPPPPPSRAEHIPSGSYPPASRPPPPPPSRMMHIPTGIPYDSYRPFREMPAGPSAFYAAKNGPPAPTGPRSWQQPPSTNAVPAASRSNVWFAPGSKHSTPQTGASLPPRPPLSVTVPAHRKMAASSANQVVDLTGEDEDEPVTHMVKSVSGGGRGGDKAKVENLAKEAPQTSKTNSAALQTALIDNAKTGQSSRNTPQAPKPSLSPVRTSPLIDKAKTGQSSILVPQTSKSTLPNVRPSPVATHWPQASASKANTTVHTPPVVDKANVGQSSKQPPQAAMLGPNTVHSSPALDKARTGQSFKDVPRASKTGPTAAQGPPVVDKSKARPSSKEALQASKDSPAIMQSASVLSESTSREASEAPMDISEPPSPSVPTTQLSKEEPKVSATASGPRPEPPVSISKDSSPASTGVPRRRMPTLPSPLIWPKPPPPDPLLPLELPPAKLPPSMYPPLKPPLSMLASIRPSESITSSSSAANENQARSGNDRGTLATPSATSVRLAARTIVPTGTSTSSAVPTNRPVLDQTSSTTSSATTGADAAKSLPPFWWHSAPTATVAAPSTAVQIAPLTSPAAKHRQVTKNAQNDTKLVTQVITSSAVGQTVVSGTASSRHVTEGLPETSHARSGASQSRVPDSLKALGDNNTFVQAWIALDKPNAKKDVRDSVTEKPPATANDPRSVPQVPISSLRLPSDIPALENSSQLGAPTRSSSLPNITHTNSQTASRLSAAPIVPEREQTASPYVGSLLSPSTPEVIPADLPGRASTTTVITTIPNGTSAMTTVTSLQTVSASSTDTSSLRPSPRPSSSGSAYRLRPVTDTVPSRVTTPSGLRNSVILPDTTSGIDLSHEQSRTERRPYQLSAIEPGEDLSQSHEETHRHSQYNRTQPEDLVKLEGRDGVKLHPAVQSSPTAEVRLADRKSFAKSRTAHRQLLEDKLLQATDPTEAAILHSSLQALGMADDPTSAQTSQTWLLDDPSHSFDSSSLTLVSDNIVLSRMQAGGHVWVPPQFDAAPRAAARPSPYLADQGRLSLTAVPSGKSSKKRIFVLHDVPDHLMAPIAAFLQSLGHLEAFYRSVDDDAIVAFKKKTPLIMKTGVALTVPAVGTFTFEKVRDR